MKKTIILLLLIILSGGSFILNAQTVQIGTGTTIPTYTLYAPLYIYGGSSTNVTSVSDIVYTQAELQAAGITPGAMISKIAFNKTNNAATASNGGSFKIYMNNSSLTPPLATTTTWASILATHTMVYQNNAQEFSAAIGWIDFNVTPFTYTGGSLEIAFHWYAGTGAKSSLPFKWEYTTGFETSVIGNVSTSTTPPTTLSGTAYKYRPNIKITYSLPNQPMVYDSATTIQPNTNVIMGALAQQAIVALKVNVTGNQSPYNITSLTFNTNGTTNPANITKAQLFYTNSPTFSNAVQVGSDINNPSGTFTFTPSTNNTLSTGSNYFWLTYDIASGTPDGNIVDAECTTFTLTTAGIKIPTITNPGPGRAVRYPLTGIKTINASLPTSSSNFQSFTDAVNTLSAVGVGSGGVTFNVANGTYTEQLNIPQIAGSSLSNPIIFQSNSGINTDVILQANPTSTNNYVLQFNEADYISFKNMTIQLTGTISSYACVVSGIGMSDYITLYGNKIIGYIGTGTTTAYAPVWFQSGATNMSNNLTIQNNTILNGSYGIYIYGTSATALETGNKIIGNTIDNFYYYGIYSYYQDGVEISSNTITGSQSAYSTQYALYMGYNDNASKALKNKIHARGTSTSYALYPYYCDGASGQEVLIANNFVTITQSTGTAYGLYSYYGNYQKIYHNSFNVTAGSATGGIGMYFYSPATGTYGNIDVQNNVSVNTGGGYAVGIVTNAVTLGYVSNMDYNNYYATGTNLGLYGTAVTNLSAWQNAATGKDINSISIDPGYYSVTDLHASGTAMNSNCNLLTDVPDDIDGQSRNNPTDMGADEFTPSGMTVSSIDVSQPNTAVVMSATNNNQILKFDIVTSGSLNPLLISDFEFNTNGSSNALNDISNAKLWSTGNVDNFSTAIQIGNASLNPNGLFTINSGSGIPAALDAGHNYFWLTYDINLSATEYNVVDAELVSVNASGNIFNPVNGAPTGSRLIRMPFTGVYTINNSQPTGGNNFNSFNDAITALSTLGVGNGGATFNVANGTYNEQISIPEIQNTSLSNPLIFQSASGNPDNVILQFTPTSANNYVIQFNGTDYTTIKNMTIQLTGTISSYANVINGIGMSEGLTIYGNKINGYNGTTGTAYAAIYFNSGTANMTTNSTIQNNIITNGSYGIYFYGGSSTVLESGNKIIGNTVNDFYNYGFYIYGQDAVQINQNTITGSGLYTTEYGIYAAYCDSAIQIRKNKVYVKPTTSTAYGIYVYYCDGTATNTGLISNNFVVQTSSTSTVYGISNYYSYYQNYYFNSVQINAGSTSSYSYYVTGSATTAPNSVNVINNIFSNTGGGYAYYISVTGIVNNSDYNNLYATGTNLAYYTAIQANLAALQTASGKNMNSKSVNPMFASSTDLHINNNINLLAAGTNTTGIIDDIDGDLRATTPCIGADEFIVLNNDLKVKAIYTLGKLPLQTGSPHFVKALIENSGINTQSNINVTLNISGLNTFADVKNIASLSPGAVDTITFSGFTPSTLGLNNVKVSIPNDDNNANNQLNYRQEVTSNTFACADTSSVTTNLGFATGDGYFVARYKINGSKQVYTSKAYITGSSTVGKELYGVIFNANGVLLDTSFHKIIQSNDINTYVSFDFVHPTTTFTTDNYIYVGIAQVANATAYYPMGCQAETPTRRGVFYYNTGLTTYNPTEALNWGRFMISAVVGDPANKDATITQIVNPVSGCGLNNQSITVKIKNEGSQAILASDGMIANYRVNNGNVVSQNVNLDIAPLSSVNFTFNVQGNFPAASADVNYLLTSWVDLPNDPLKLNDTLRKSFTSGYVPPSPTANNVSSLYADTARLNVIPANASDTIINWYHNINDTVIFHTGLSYTTPVLFDTATYYVASGGGKADLKITELAIYKTGTGATPVYPSWASGADLFEITNLGNASVNMLGYKFNIYGTTNPLNYTFTTSFEVKPGEIVILNSQSGTDDVSHRYFNMGGTTDIQSATANGYVLKAPDNTVIDAVAVNSYTFAAGEASTSDWSGNIPSSSTFAGVIRITSDNNNASDWIVSSATNTQTIGSINPTLTAGASSSSCQSSRVSVKAMISNFPALDAGISNLVLPATSVNGGSTIPVKVKIHNYGLNTLTNATIGWSINGVNQTPFSWTGSIAHGITSSEVTIANYVATVPGILNIKTWPITLNSSADSYAINDTASGNITISMSGNYSIGTSGADFTTINQAVNLLNTVGVGSNVTFNIKPGTYTENFIINQVEGADSSKTITFKSENNDSTSVVISFSSTAATDNYVVRLNGTDYINFKNLTLKNDGVTYGRVFDLLGGTNFINIANSIIESSATGTATTTAGIYSASGIDSNIVIENNNIKNGYYGIYIYGSSSTAKESNNIIRNNSITDFYYYGLYLYYQNNIEVIGNLIKNRSNASIHYGIYHYYNDNVTNMKNQIYLNGSSSCYGLYLYYNNNTTGNSLVANNFISQSVGSGSVYGLYSNTTKNTKYYYNTVSITKGTTSGYAFYNTGATGIQLLNNIFSNTGGGYAYYFSTNTGIDSSNNNCLFATGTNLANWGGAKTDLAALQAASGRDANSISVYPMFVDSIADLHATNAALTEKATSVPEVSDDIDGQLRSILPTIGADEFVGSKTLNVTVFLEGLYNGAGGMNPVQDELGDKWSATIADKITIELHNSSIPSITEATFTNQDLSTNGTCSVNIPFNIGDSYYIVIKHRNSIQTWSAIPMAFNTSVINYNFSTAASQAYADNQKQLAPGLFGLFVGDVNQDEVIDLSDLVDMDVDLTIGTVAYTVYDLNGDGVVDLSDLVAIDESLTNGVVSMYP